MLNKYTCTTVGMASIHFTCGVWLHLAVFLSIFFLYLFSCCFFILNYPISDFFFTLTHTFYWFYCGYSLETPTSRWISLDVVDFDFFFTEFNHRIYPIFHFLIFHFFASSFCNPILFHWICTMPLLLLLLLAVGFIQPGNLFPKFHFEQCEKSSSHCKNPIFFTIITHCTHTIRLALVC